MKGVWKSPEGASAYGIAVFERSNRSFRKSLRIADDAKPVGLNRWTTTSPGFRESSVFCHALATGLSRVSNDRVPNWNAVGPTSGLSMKS